jgi:hypothetical protein
MQKIGRKNTVFIGVIIISIATVIFGMGGLCSHELTFFAVSFIARMF